MKRHTVFSVVARRDSNSSFNSAISSCEAQELSSLPKHALRRVLSTAHLQVRGRRLSAALFKLSSQLCGRRRVSTDGAEAWWAHTSSFSLFSASLMMVSACSFLAASSDAMSHHGSLLKGARACGFERPELLGRPPPLGYRRTMPACATRSAAACCKCRVTRREQRAESRSMLSAPRPRHGRLTAAALPVHP